MREEIQNQMSVERGDEEVDLGIQYSLASARM